MFRVPEKYRLRYTKTHGPMNETWGCCGIFIVPGPPASSKGLGRELRCGVSDGSGWEHVSVTIDGTPASKEVLPTRKEMAFIKSVFWEPEDWVVEFHPPESQYVNNHKGCLHLWRPLGGEGLLTPPPIMVGLKEGENDELLKKLWAAPTQVERVAILEREAPELLEAIDKDEKVGIRQ